MTVDLSAPTRAAIKFFGESAQGGGKVTYQRLVGGAPFLLDGVFDAAWQDVSFTTNRHGVPVSTTKPCLGVRLADFPAGVQPAQGDTITRFNGEDYTVADTRPDGFGYVYLILD